MNLLLLSNHQSATGHKALAFVIEALGLKGQAGGYIGSEPDPEGDFYRPTQAFYQGLGIGLNTYLDFEQGFNDTVMQTLLDKPLVHLSGGDTYRFLRGLHSRNQQQKLKSYAASGHLLVGVSAGAMLLTANIETAALCGDSNTVGLENLKALCLADLLLVPHVVHSQSRDQSHGLSQKQRAKQLAKRHGLPVYLCSDEDALAIIDGYLHCFGAPELILPEAIA